MANVLEPNTKVELEGSPSSDEASEVEFVPYGKEWQRDMAQFPKDALLERVGSILQSKSAEIERLQGREFAARSALAQGRHYLMGVEAGSITVPDALEAFGFGRNGLGV